MIRRSPLLHVCGIYYAKGELLRMHRKLSSFVKI